MDFNVESVIRVRWNDTLILTYPLIENAVRGAILFKFDVNMLVSHLWAGLMDVVQSRTSHPQHPTNPPSIQNQNPLSINKNRTIIVNHL